MITRRILVLLLFLFVTGNVYSQAPVAQIKVIDPNGCAPFVANFQDNSTGGTPTSWLWDFDDPNAPGTSTQQNPTHFYQLPGLYKVKMTVSNVSGFSIDSINITVFKNPTANFIVSDDTICSGGSITFTDSSELGDAPINSWSWTFNDGTPVEHVNPVTHICANNSNQISPKKSR